MSTVSVPEAALVSAQTLFADDLVGNILDGIFDSIERLVSNSVIQVNNALKDLINRLESTYESIMRDVQDFLDTAVTELENVLVFRLYQLKLATDDLVEEVFDEAEALTASVIRDINRTLSNAWPFSDDFSIDEIEGTLVEGVLDQDHTLSVTGLNMGTGSESVNTEEVLTIVWSENDTVTLNGEEVENDTVFFNVDKAKIADYRKDDEFVRISCRLTTKVSKDRRFWFGEDVEEYEHSFYLTLTPLNMGQVGITGIEGIYDWHRSPNYKNVYQLRTQSGHPNGTMRNFWASYNLPTVANPPKVGDRRFYRAMTGRALGEGNRHLYHWDATVVDGGRAVNTSGQNNSHSIVLEIIAWYEMWQRISHKNVSGTTTAYKAEEPFELKVSKNAETVRIKGRDKQAGAIDLVAKNNPRKGQYGMPEGRYGELDYLGYEVAGNQLVYRFMRK